MKFVDYNGETLALFLAKPNLRAAKRSLTASLPFTNVDEALSGSEGRTNFGRSSRYTFEFSPYFRTAAPSTEFRLGLNRLSTETIAVPLWTDGVKISVLSNAGSSILSKTANMPARYGAEWIILNDNASLFEIVVVNNVTSSQVQLGTDTTLNWPANVMMFPLLFCRFDERPKLELITASTVKGGVKFVEDSPIARRINPVAIEQPLVGASVPNHSTAPLWNIEPTTSQQIDTTELDVLYRALGFQRTDESYVDSLRVVRRGEEIEVVCKSATATALIAQIEGLFLDRRGPVRGFMKPTFRNDLELAEDLPDTGNANHIVIRPSEYTDDARPARPGDPYIAIIQTITPATATANPTTLISPQKITNVASTTLITTVALTDVFSAAKARISHLLRVRFAQTTLSWTYSANGEARARIKFLETPDEYVSPLPDQPQRAYVYRFTEYVDIAVNRGLYTSYESPIDYVGATWQPAPIEHKSEKETLTLDDTLEIATWDFSEIAGVVAENPLRRIVDGTIEGELWCDVDEVNVLDPDDGTAKFIIGGKIKDVDTTGKDWTAVIDPFAGMLDESYPRFYKQKVCNVALFSPRCAFARPTMKEDFKSVGTIAAITDTSVDLSIDSSNLDPLSQDNGFFARGGWLEGGTGLTFERRAITGSEVVGGNVRLHFKRPLLHSGVGAQLRFWLGCNRSMETCDRIFDNRPNFRGHNNVPTKNPSANIGQVQQSSGGKKGG